MEKSSGINWRVYAVPTITIGYLFWLAVLPGHRRKGIGLDLTNRAIQIIYEKNGPIDIYTAAEKKNEISQNLRNNRTLPWSTRRK